ncbi:hypothetical protein BC962_1431 [Gillisia mitskevichiae]|uniref:Uncharacterized protein n=1 Tax=Gillisia mitskevichiae TaxID=270921 RepID=A0A495PUF0_9FLAO|nr:hypothetical protein BC962_1431 [Gillisia mitskevichiae]
MNIAPQILNSNLLTFYRILHYLQNTKGLLFLVFTFLVISNAFSKKDILRYINSDFINFNRS